MLENVQRARCQSLASWSVSGGAPSCTTCPKVVASCAALWLCPGCSARGPGLHTCARSSCPTLFVAPSFPARDSGWPTNVSAGGPALVCHQAVRRVTQGGQELCRSAAQHCFSAREASAACVCQSDNHMLRACMIAHPMQHGVRWGVVRACPPPLAGSLHQRMQSCEGRGLC